MPEEAPYDTQWKNVVTIVQVEFRDRTFKDESMWYIVVLIPKGDGRNLKGGCLMEILW